MAAATHNHSVQSLKALMKATIPEGTKVKNKDEKPKAMAGAFAGLFPSDLSVVSCRNVCDEVYPGIIIGDNRYARDVDKLVSLGVSHVLNAAQGRKFAQIDSNADTFSDAHIHFLGIQAQDFATFKLAQHFHEAADFIHNALIDKKGKVFVHCFEGISRSATLVLVYLMLYQKLTLEEAIITIRKKRAVFPNDGFLNQLIELEERLSEDRAAETETSDVEQSVTECNGDNVS